MSGEESCELIFHIRYDRYSSSIVENVHPMLTIVQVSEWLHIKPSTLYAWVSQGKIPHVKIHGLIRFQPDEIQQWLASFHTQNANPLKWKEKKGRGVNNLDTIIPGQGGSL
jgi:excisionase family DNA binding protein